MSDKKRNEYRPLNLPKEKLDEITIKPEIKDGKILLDRNNSKHRYIMEEAFDMGYEKMSTEELQKLVGLDKVGSIRASAGDEAAIREEGDSFADWYREELIQILKEDNVKEIDKTNVTGLTDEKKEILRKQNGSASSKVDLNKVRDWWKYEATDENKE